MRSLIVCVHYFGRWEDEKPPVFLRCRSARGRAAQPRARNADLVRIWMRICGSGTPINARADLGHVRIWDTHQIFSLSQFPAAFTNITRGAFPTLRFRNPGIGRAPPFSTAP